MLKRMCTAKIANAYITKAELHYEGSCGIDASVLEASGILPYEMVLIANVTNGRRFETYTIPEAPGSGAMRGYFARLPGACAPLRLRGQQVGGEKATLWHPTLNPSPFLWRGQQVSIDSSNLR